MTLTLNLPPELEQYLTQQAQQQGLSKAKRNPTLLIIISWWVGGVGFHFVLPNLQKS